jgi:hypothetical protein
MTVISRFCAHRPRNDACADQPRRSGGGGRAPNHERRLLKRLSIAIRLAAVATALAASSAKAADPLDTWAAADTGTAANLRAVIYANGQFVSVGDWGTILTSSDGAAWTAHNTGTTNQLSSVANGGGRFVAVGGGTAPAPKFGASILTSRDGMAWTQADPGTTNAIYYSIAYGNGRFVAVGGADTRMPAVVSSVDGVEWTPWKWTWPDPQSAPPAITGVACGNGIFVAVWQGGGANFPPVPALVFTSADGVDWALHAGPANVSTVVFGNGEFIGVGGYYGPGGGRGQPQIPHGVIYSSPDGTNWTHRLDISGGMFTSVGYGAGQYFAGDDSGGYNSADGVTWTGHAGPDAEGIAFGNGMFITVGRSGRVARSGAIGKLGASLTPAGQFLGTIAGVTGQSYAIETSTNLGAWNDLTKVTITNGSAQFGDPGVKNSMRRFYKATTVGQ